MCEGMHVQCVDITPDIISFDTLLFPRSSVCNRAIHWKKLSLPTISVRKVTRRKGFSSTSNKTGQAVCGRQGLSECVRTHVCGLYS